MKFHTEMTNEELLALTEQQIEDCAKLLLVKDGNPLPYPKPVVPTVETEIGEPVCKVYEICDVRFEKFEDAAAMLKSLENAITLGHQYMPGSYMNLTVMPTNGAKKGVTKEIKEISVYSPEVALRASKVFADADKLKKPLVDWEATQNEYEARLQDVREAIHVANKTKQDEEKKKLYMDECLRLADNDKVIAQRFFEKRYPIEQTAE